MILNNCCEQIVRPVMFLVRMAILLTDILQNELERNLDKLR